MQTLPPGQITLSSQAACASSTHAVPESVLRQRRPDAQSLSVAQGGLQTRNKQT
jgi:hypothetical protein